jgi:hypothetical protein
MFRHPACMPLISAPLCNEFEQTCAGRILVPHISLDGRYLPHPLADGSGTEWMAGIAGQQLQNSLGDLVARDGHSFYVRRSDIPVW